MDKKKAIKATKHGAVAAFISAGVTFVFVLLAMFSNADGYMGHFNDPSIFFDVIFILICGFGVRRQSRVAAIAIFIYFIFAKIYIGFETGKIPSSGIALVVLYFYGRAIQGAFAYHKIQKEENPNYKSTPKWMYYAGIPTGVLMLALVGLAIMQSAGVLTSSKVVTGSEMNSKDLSLLTDKGIVHPSEKIEYFYSEGFSSILEGGNVLTDNRVVVYTQEEGDLQIYGLPIQDIVSIELIKQGNFLNDSIYEVRSFNKDAWLRLLLSTEGQGDVIFIEALREKTNKTNNISDVPHKEELATYKPSEIFKKSNESVVLIRVYDEKGNVISFGSGVCVHSNGTIITNFHVISSDSFYFDIKFQKHGVFEDVYISGMSPILEDYIVLKVGGKDLPSVDFSLRNEYEIGERVITIGNPEGLLNSISDGVVSGRRFYGDYEYYQMTAPISQGSSGGAVFDEQGNLVGISTAIHEEGQNLNFFLPVYRIYNNAEIFATVLTLEQFNSLCRNRAEEYKKTGDQFLLSKDYEQANNNYEISLKYYDSNADAYYANSTALYQLGLEDEALADLIGAALLYYHYDEKDKLLYVKRRAEEMSLPAEVVDVFDIQNMEKLLKGYNKDDDLRKLFRSKDDLTKDLLQFKEKSDENDVSQNLGLFSSGLIVSGGKSGVNILEISQVCPAWEAGLRGGDIITEIEGKEINSLESYVEIMQNLNKTRRLKIALVVHRRGVLYNVSIKRTN